LTPVRISIERDPGAKDLPLPRYATAGSAGMDLHAAITEAVSLAPGERALVSTGIRLAVPEGYEAQVRPRSGLALRQGLALVNSPGTIDSDYRNTVGVILINLGQEPVRIERGDRIAQLVVTPVVRVEWEEATPDALLKTLRGENGFGSTGYH
jgi:dUTP pyrophosphatase